MNKPQTAKRQRETIQDLVDEIAEDPWLNLTSVATVLQVHPSTVGRWVDDGILPHEVVGRLPKVRKSVLLNFIAMSALKQKDQARSVLLGEDVEEVDSSETNESTEDLNEDQISVFDGEIIDADDLHKVKGKGSGN